MDFNKWANSKIKNFNWTDVAFVKLSVLGFALMIASLFPVIISVDWYWYLGVFVLCSIKPLMKAFGKR